jgi:hypothetical protein
MDVYLEVLTGAHAGKAVRVLGPRFFVGRDPSCDLRPNSDAVSRHHGQLILSKGRVFVRDLGSSNGTYVNEEPVGGDWVRANHGDVLAFGPLEFRLVVVSMPARAIGPNVPRSTARQTVSFSGANERLLGAGTADARAEDIAFQALSDALEAAPAAADTLPEVAAQGATDTVPVVVASQVSTNSTPVTVAAPSPQPIHEGPGDTTASTPPISTEPELETATGSGTFISIAPPPTARLKPSGNYEGVSKAANDILAKMVARAQAHRRLPGPPKTQG